MKNKDIYYGFRHPGEIISHAVWPYFRLTLSFRDVEEILASRGIEVTYESIRQWCLYFGQDYAKKIRAKQGRHGDTWHLDEVFIKINGKLHYLWRAVDQDGDTLDILVQSRKNKKAARRFFRKLLKGLMYSPNKIVTDKLKFMARLIKRWGYLQHTKQGSTKTTALKIHTNERGNKKDRCGDLNLQVMPNGFYPRMGPLITFHARIAI